MTTSPTVRVRTEHDATIGPHEWRLGYDEKLDAIGRRNAETHRWLTFVCSHGDCPADAIVRHDAITGALLPVPPQGPIVPPQGPDEEHT